jgi:hypothetical protein
MNSMNSNNDVCLLLNVLIIYIYSQVLKLKFDYIGIDNSNIINFFKTGTVFPGT